jgi:putative copper resistance protein D
MILASLVLLQEAEHGITVGAVVMRYVDFLAYFPIFGALGFYFMALRRTRQSEIARSRSAPALLSAGERRAAGVALVGTLFYWITLVQRVIERGAEKNLPLMQAASSLGGRFILQALCGLAFLLGFAMASRGSRGGWVLAGIAAIALALRNSTTGRWFSMVNPLHEVAASLWIGTLFVTMIAGIVLAIRRLPPGSDQESLVAELISNFSPLALSAASLLGITGVLTAWRHLNPLSSLWSTPYGYALIVKLCFVACVVSMGWWNWKRVTPKLGVEGGAREIRRSARRELMFAGMVLLVTGVLLSLPAPRRPGGAEQPTGPTATRNR